MRACNINLAMCSQLAQQCKRLLVNESCKYFSNYCWTSNNFQKKWLLSRLIHIESPSCNKKFPTNHQEDIPGFGIADDASDRHLVKKRNNRYKKRSKASGKDSEAVWKVLSETHEDANNVAQNQAKKYEKISNENDEDMWKVVGDSLNSTRKRRNRKNPKKNTEISDEIFGDALLSSGEFPSGTSRKKAGEDMIAANLNRDPTTEKEKNTPLQLTTKKLAKKPPPNAERDNEMLHLLQEVVSEFDVSKEEGNIVKRDLSKRFQIIQEQKAATESHDFQSLLKEIRESSLEGESGGFQWETSRPGLNANQPALTLDLSSGKRLEIFNKEDFVEEQEIMNPDQSTWSALDWYKHYMSLNSQKINLDPGKYYAWDAYDELVRWTDEGKMWKFPINNEQNMDEEAEVPFYEHVFLQDKLNEGDWCPKVGPIRNFMTSVVTALSLNAFLTVKEKHEHIEWFRDYFNERLDTIKKLGLIE